MRDLEALATVHGWAAVEFAAWGWAATLTDAGVRRNVELALGLHGVDGIGDLVAVGPTLGGLSAVQLSELMTAVRADFGGKLRAA